MRYLLIILLFSFSVILLSQEIEIINVNSDNFPIIEAVIYSEDHISVVQEFFKKEDFAISEKNKEHKVFKIINPQQKVLPLSILIVFDISGSMKGNRIQVVQNAAYNFISRIPLQYTEVAIASFNQAAIINCDFTHNRNKLLYALNNLNPGGGTSYTEAYLNDAMGALEIVKSGKNKKVIVFLTDGQSSIDSEKVIPIAHENEIAIYNVTVDLPIPEQLKNISVQSGGSYYESAHSDKELGGIFLKMLSRIQSDLYGKIYWRASYGCDYERAGIIEYKDQSLSYFYSIPESKVSRLISDQNELVFGNIKSGTLVNSDVILKAENAPLIINQSILNNKEYKILNSLRFDTLKPGEERKITVQYSPKEPGISKSNLKLLIENCPEKLITISGGEKERINIVSPKGNEKYIVNSDTSIRWDGLKYDREVDIYYRISDTGHWFKVGTGSNQRYQWKVPGTAANNVYVKLQPRTVNQANLKFHKEIKLEGFKSIFQTYNRDDSQIMFSKSNGDIVVIDKNSNELLLNARGLENRGVCYNKKDKIVSFGKNQISVHDSYFGRIISSFTTNKNIVSSIILQNNKEYLIPSSVRKLKDGRIIIRSPLYENQDTISDTSPVRQAVITESGNRAITINKEKILKIWNLNTDSVLFEEKFKDNNTYIVSPNQKTALIKKSITGIQILDMDNANTLFDLNGYSYLRFSRSGDYFICVDKDSSLCFFDSYTGELLRCIPDNYSFLTFNKGYCLLVYRTDTLVLEKLDDKSLNKELYIPGLTDFIVSPDDKSIVLLNSSGAHSVISSKTFEVVSEINTEPGFNYKACYSNSGSELLIQTEDYMFEIWTPELLEFERAISNSFSIIKPTIHVSDSIYIGEFKINESSEIQLNALYKNISDVPAIIVKVELLGNNFSLVQGINDYNLKSGETRGIELRYTPESKKEDYAQMICYTPFDTLSTILYGKGAFSQFDFLSNSHNLGKIKLKETIDTSIALLTNTGKSLINITNIYNNGPDTNQFYVSGKGEDVALKQGDTLYVKIRFTGIEGGRTATNINFRIANSDTTNSVVIFGDVLAPRSYQIAGKTLDALDSLPICADVVCVDLETNYCYSKQKSGMEGNFNFTVYPGRSYGLFANTIDYFSSGQQVDLTGNYSSDTLYRNIYLSKIENGAVFRLDCIFFDFNSSKLKEESFAELNKVIELLNNKPEISVEIHGHTDNVGSKSYNIELSGSRAQSIKNYIVSKGINRERISIKAWGFSRPVTSNKDESGRAQNRRVEIIIR